MTALLGESFDSLFARAAERRRVRRDGDWARESFDATRRAIVARDVPPDREPPWKKALAKRERERAKR